MKLLDFKPNSHAKSQIKRKWYLILIPIISLMILILFSFRPKETIDATQRNLSFKINGKFWESVKILDASISRSEQTQNIFAKTLNINGIDNKGTSIALTIFDVDKADIGKCLTVGKYFGQEHTDVHKNFTFDIGVASFSNKCNLIYQSDDGNLLSSRNGFVSIEKCDNGKISGSFEFQSDSGEVFSNGKFVDVLFKFED